LFFGARPRHRSISWSPDPSHLSLTWPRDQISGFELARDLRLLNLTCPSDPRIWIGATPKSLRSGIVVFIYGIH
jgi:hypothetical protein